MQQACVSVVLAAHVACAVALRLFASTVTAVTEDVVALRFCHAHFTTLNTEALRPTAQTQFCTACEVLSKRSLRGY